MKKLYNHLKKVRRELIALLLISIAGYFLIVWLNIFPEIFSGANKVGEFFSKLCMAYTTSFIFYFVVVHIKSEKDKDNVNEYVAIQLSDIVTSGHLFFAPFKKGSFEKLTLNDFPSSVFCSVNRFAPESFYRKNDDICYTWVECYEILKKNTFEALDVIFKRYNHLDTKLIKLLSRVEYSMMFFQWDLLYHIEYDLTFGMFEMQLKTYFVAIRELQEYTEQNFRPAAQIRGEFMRVPSVMKSNNIVGR